MSFKPRLLRETAEIALNEIKRYIEPHLTEQLSLRRVSAPLFLPVDSPLLDSRHPGARITLPGVGGEVEIVGSLDVWLRGQLSRYDIAAGFGVFTIMTALRPSLPLNSTSSPHIAAWAWQQAVETPGRGILLSAAKKIYSLLVDTERMILDKFPHLKPALKKNLEVIDSVELERETPNLHLMKCIKEHLQADSARESSESGHCASMLLLNDDGNTLSADLWVWNRMLNCPLHIADFRIWNADSVACASVGGNIYRDFLALQILHQHRLLV